MTKQQIGALLTSLCAATLMTAAAHAEDKAVDAAHEHDSTGHQCQNNNCKGHAECMGFGNTSCGGQNSCKGKGWVGAKNEAECTTKKGLWHGAKAANEKPAPKAKKTKTGT